MIPRQPLVDPRLFNANPTVGAMEIGVLIAVMLFGLLTVQCYVYAQNFPQDSRAMKTLVITIWILEFAHVLLTCHTLYEMTVINYGRPETLSKTPTSFNIAVVLSSTISPLVQSFFANRVRIISGRPHVAIVCWILTGIRSALIIVVGYGAFTMTSLTQFRHKWLWLLTTVLIISAIVDVVIAVSLCYYLFRQRSVVHERSTMMVDTLIKWTVQTGLITGLSTLAMLFTFIAMSQNFAWLALFTVIARLFSNSLLASLNGRNTIRALRQDCSITVSSSRNPIHTPHIAISMDKMTNVTRDNDNVIKPHSEEENSLDLKNDISATATCVFPDTKV